MVADLRQLAGWQIPDKIQYLTRRDVAFYALSIGVGRDPNDPDHLRFVDPASAELQALPSMALVIGYPGFWLGDPELALDVGRIFHVEQSIQIMATLPLEGRVIGRTRVTDVEDRGPGKSVIVRSERDILNDQGQILAKLEQVHMLQGYGGFSGVDVGPSRRAPAVERPAEPADLVDVAIRPEQALLYRLNGDLNPMHSDPAVAAAAGFPAPIMHGMCTFGMVAKTLIDRLCSGDAAGLVSMSARFTGPLHPGETLRTAIFEDGSFSAVCIDRDKPVLGDGLARTTGQKKLVLEADHAI